MQRAVRVALAGACLTATLAPVASAQGEAVPSPRIDIPMPDIRARIMARLKSAPRLQLVPTRRPTRADEPKRPPAAPRAAPIGKSPPRPVREPPRPEAITERPADRASERPAPTLRDVHVPMPVKTVIIRTLDDLDRLEAQYFRPRKAGPAR